MTVKGDDSKKDAVTRNEDEHEQVPSYQEAIEGTSSSSSQPAVSSNAAASGTGKVGGAATTQQPSAPSQQNQQQSSNMYPFPSMSPQLGYGQSPYQSTGTLPIVIVQGSNLLPLHATAITSRRGPQAGRRFIFAFFWAVLLYMILGAVTGALVQLQDNANQPKTPPGWHHHHKGQTQIE